VVDGGHRRDSGHGLSISDPILKCRAMLLEVVVWSFARIPSRGAIPM
jgi:hypothetical protein